MDFRELLKKYIDYVAEMEGTDFLGHYGSNKEFFTEEEWRILTELSGHE
jgi:hypothetical protein